MKPDMKPDMERRTYAAELRVEDGEYTNKNPTIKGYAAKFNALSGSMPIFDEGRQIGTFKEQLLPGCFTKALETSDVRALINHDPNLILGRKQAGTLRMIQNEIGLMFENDPPKTGYADDIQVSMRRGDIDKCSFGFNVAEGGDTYIKDPNVENGYIRSIHEISNLFDVSVVTYPAYDDTICSVRSAVAKIQADEAEVLAGIKAKDDEERQIESEARQRSLQLAEV